MVVGLFGKGIAGGGEKVSSVGSFGSSMSGDDKKSPFCSLSSLLPLPRSILLPDSFPPSSGSPPPLPSVTIMTPPPLDEDNEMLVPHSDLADGVQPMVTSAEVPAPPASAANTQPAPEESPPISRFTWTLEHFSGLHPRKRYSEVFSVGGYKWRVLVTVFPKGNKAGHLSMYLDVADSGNLPYGWS